MKKAIATIATEVGTMNIYFNGANEEMTAEAQDTIEEIGCAPESIEEAIETLEVMYSNPKWDLEVL